MSPIEIGIIAIALMFLLIFIGLPVGVSMGLLGFAGIWLLISETAAMSVIAHIPFGVITNYDYATLILFIFMGHVIFVTGIGQDMFDLAAKWLGHLPGGLAIAATGACTGFAAISSSSLATASTIGLISIPEMRKYKYDPALATGCVAAGGTMGSLIPPSGILIVYGLITETSIGKLFMAGIIPGLIQAAFYITTIYLLCRWKPSMGPLGPRYGFKERIKALRNCGELLFLIVLVLGGLMIGWFTPTESGAVGAAGAIAISLLRRRLTWQLFKEAVLGSLKTGGMIYTILIGAMLFKQFITVTTIPIVLAEVLTGMQVSPYVIILAIVFLYFILGCIMDPMAMVLLTVPIFLPLITSLGFDPIWFAIIVVKMTEIGAITPPLGMNVYVIAGITPDVPMQTVFKGIVPFLVAEVFDMSLLLSFPAIILFLPKLLFG